MKKGYYDKKEVYGDNPLKEWIYEIEDCLMYIDGEEEKIVKHSALKKIFECHNQTLKEFIRRNYEIK